MKRWLPNLVSISRAVISPFVVISAIGDNWFQAFVLFNLGFASDGIDGWLAEKLNAKTWIGGKILDPVADLTLVVSGLAGLLFTGVISWLIMWILALVFILVWAIIFLISPTKKIHFICVSFAPFYYLGVALVLVGYYAYQAFGSEAKYLFIIYIPLIAIIAYLKRHRIKQFLLGNS